MCFSSNVNGPSDEGEYVEVVLNSLLFIMPRRILRISSASVDFKNFCALNVLDIVPVCAILGETPNSGCGSLCRTPCRIWVIY
jgi:hypothetical protein